MKTFREYLTESKKQFAYKVKIAGEVPEKFAENLKKHLSDVNCSTCSEGQKIPVSHLPVDFPEHEEHKEVTVFDVITDYPTTPQQISKHVTEIGGHSCCFVVKTATDPTEIEQAQFVAEKSGTSLLGAEYEDNIKHKNYFGDDFNKSFLQQLSKDAAERKKEVGHNEEAMKDVDVLASQMKEFKQDKAGANSPVGSK